jgi:HPt (histidine-containing phosphotransfer) domain-containing protein
MVESDPDARDAAFEAEMAVLRQHYVASLTTRRAALVEAWDGCADQGEDAAWQRLRDVAHKLAGSASSYGFETLGGTARGLDRQLSGRTPCRARGQVEAQVAALLAALDAAIGTA